MHALNAKKRLAPMATAALVIWSACGERNTYQPPPPAEVSVAKPEQRKVTLYMEVTCRLRSQNRRLTITCSRINRRRPPSTSTTSTAPRSQQRASIVDSRTMRFSPTVRPCFARMKLHLGASAPCVVRQKRYVLYTPRDLDIFEAFSRGSLTMGIVPRAWEHFARDTKIATIAAQLTAMAAA